MVEDQLQFFLRNGVTVISSMFQFITTLYERSDWKNVNKNLQSVIFRLNICRKKVFSDVAPQSGKGSQTVVLRCSFNRAREIGYIFHSIKGTKPKKTTIPIMPQAGAADAL